eukprot:SAG31_NODE_363_length_16899_cov_9.812976_1_plen_43_part_10
MIVVRVFELSAPVRSFDLMVVASRRELEMVFSLLSVKFSLLLC